MSIIAEFYKDKTVFVTGGTGFLGKTMVEKLLRSCDTKKIFLLLRSKRGQSAEQRLESYFDSEMYAGLAEQKPDYRRKIEVLEGDIQQPNLGLREEDIEKIIQEVEIIFHWAATVNFVENFKVATNTNVKPARDLLIIARKMLRLKSFLYASTAYSHCIISEIHETFYDDTIEGKNLITCMDSITEKTADDITAGLLGKWPNTYVYTKSAAENIVKTEGLGLPIGIYRPSIVTGAYKEPMPGWLDAKAGYAGLVTAICLGFIRVLMCNPAARINFVPVDYVVNSAIAAAWQISQQDPNKISIYNFTDAMDHCLYFERFRGLIQIEGHNVASPKVVWHHSMVYTTKASIFKILDYCLHYLPAKLMDFIYVCSGKNPMFVKIYDKMDKLSGALMYFVCNEWNFNNKNIVSLWNSMCERDRELFEFDMSALNWNDYIANTMLGIKFYVLKESLDTVPAGRKKMLLLKIAHNALVTILLLAFCYLILIVILRLI